jgi:protease-4
VGSIGATASFLNNYEKDKKDGVVYEQLSSGPFKDTFSPDKPLTDDEKKLILRDIQILRDHFVNLVSSYRHQPQDKISALADGSTVLGAQALSNGLIDEIGGTNEASAYIEDKIGEPVNKCWQ